MIATCERTGIQFETESKRQKNHPLVSRFLDEANKDGKRYAGAYGAAANILIDIKAAKIETIEEAMSYANAAYSAWKNGEAKPVIRKTQGDYLRDWKAARDRRERINAILRQHGYRWSKEEVGSEDDWAGPHSLGAGIGEVVGHRWTLNAPDGREVSIQQAFHEIGQEIPE